MRLNKILFHCLRDVKEVPFYDDIPQKTVEVGQKQDLCSDEKITDDEGKEATETPQLPSAPPDFETLGEKPTAWNP